MPPVANEGTREGTREERMAMTEYDHGCAQVTCEVVDIINACKRIDKILHQHREHWDEQYYNGVTSCILKLCDMLPGRD